MLQGGHMGTAISVPTVIVTTTAEGVSQTGWTAQTQGIVKVKLKVRAPGASRTCWRGKALCALKDRELYWN